MISPAAENYMGIPGYAIFWVLFAVALGLFLQRVWLLLRLLKLGKQENRFDHPVRRLLSMAGTVLTQSTNFKTLTLRDPASIGHALMFWGLGFFAVGYVVFLGFGTGLSLFSVLSGSTFERVYYSILDIAALFILISMIWVIVKRYIVKPERLRRQETTAEKVTQGALITVIILLMVFHYFIEGSGYAVSGIPDAWPPIGTAIATALANSGLSATGLETLYHTLWWINYLLLLAAIIYAPRSKHLHPLFSFANIAFRDLGPKGALKQIDIEKKEQWGASNIQDLSWKQLLDGYACTWCGRCHIACPAQASGKSLSPREFILGMKSQLLKAGPGLLKSMKDVPDDAGENNGASIDAAAGSRDDSLLGSVISEDAVWACTTCGACQEVCPSCNEQMSDIIDLRRHLQMTAATETAKDTLKNIRVRGNPWRGTMYARTDWAEGLDIKVLEDNSDIDVLFWVGCTGALEDRSIRVVQALARLMKQAGINFGILGEEERCCGDPARRLGAEHLFQMLAAANIQTLTSYNIKKIVTACPHCYNTLKNEYPRMGGQFEVIHHSQFIGELINSGKITIPRSRDAVITYHDACYLGRYNNLYEAPRQVLKSIPGVTLVEMEKNLKNGFCCGGGGGRMWLEEETGQRINEIRFSQAIDTRAGMLATACPFCLQMFEDAAKANESETMQIRDIAEIVAEASDLAGNQTIVQEEVK